MTKPDPATVAKRKAAKRARRPIYMVVATLMDPATGQRVGCLIPASPIDKRLMRERKFTINKEIRAELKQPRNPVFHRLMHRIGMLLVDNVEAFSGKDGHEAVKDVQMSSGVCCDLLELDLGPLGKVTAKQPRSIAFDEMEQDEFKALFEGVVKYIAENYTHVMLDDVRNEFWRLVDGDRNPHSAT